MAAGEWLDVGLTIVDALDTLLVMGLDDEADEARDWIAGRGANGVAGEGVRTAVWSSPRIRTRTCSRARFASWAVCARRTSSGGHEGARSARQGAGPGGKARTGVQDADGDPIMDVNFRTRDPHQPKWTQKSSLAEAGTRVLEWEALEASLRRAENLTTDALGADDLEDDAEEKRWARSRGGDRVRVLPRGGG